MAACDQILDLRSGAVDIAIRYCEKREVPAGAVRLFGERVAVVAHPALGLGAQAPARIVAGQVSLEFDGLRRRWLRWDEQLASLGLAPGRPRGTLRFNQYGQVIHGSNDAPQGWGVTSPCSQHASLPSSRARRSAECFKGVELCVRRRGGFAGR